MNNELNIVLDEMTNAELADYVLAVTCKTLSESDETDVMEVINHCLGFCNYLKKQGDCSSTKIFNVFGIIVDSLKEVAGDGGIVTISCDKI